MLTSCSRFNSWLQLASFCILLPGFLTWVCSGSSNFIIDEFDDIYLPFAMSDGTDGDRCQHHSPVGTYVQYVCNAADSTTINKDSWEEKLCVNNRTSRVRITDSEQEASSSSTISTTSTANSSYCDGLDDSVHIATYCNLDVPLQRELYLATGVCVDLRGDGSVYMSASCDTDDDSTSVYFWNNNVLADGADEIDCSSGTSEATRMIVLNTDDCVEFLNETDSGLPYTIHAMSVECLPENGEFGLHGRVAMSSLLMAMTGMLLW